MKWCDIGEVVSMGCYLDWVKFEVSFKIKCKMEEKLLLEVGKLGEEVFER